MVFYEKVKNYTLAPGRSAIGLALGLSSHYERTLDEDSFKRY